VVSLPEVCEQRHRNLGYSYQLHHAQNKVVLASNGLQQKAKTFKQWW
jgi:hypothetical protein